jgi:hypothetical protein
VPRTILMAIADGLWEDLQLSPDDRVAVLKLVDEIFESMRGLDELSLDDIGPILAHKVSWDAS